MAPPAGEENAVGSVLREIVAPPGGEEDAVGSVLSEIVAPPGGEEDAVGSVLSDIVAPPGGEEDAFGSVLNRGTMISFPCHIPHLRVCVIEDNTNTQRLLSVCQLMRQPCRQILPCQIQ